MKYGTDDNYRTRDHAKLKIEIGYKWGRLRTLQSIQAEDVFKGVDISDKLAEMKKSISLFRNIRTYSTNIEKSLNELRDELKKIEEQLLGNLDEIQREMKKKSIANQ